jgi:tRNA dimethylallyltransferase
VLSELAIFSSSLAAHIDDIHARGRLPVLVGGTNFYIESLLFHNLYPQHRQGQLPWACAWCILLTAH